MPRKFVLLVSAAIVALASAWQIGHGQDPGISPAALAAAIDAGAAPLILDVRTAEEFAEGHVPGAILIPHDQLADRLSELGGATEVVVYCHSGRRAGWAGQTLDQAGIGVSQLQGSWLGWQKAGLPVETTPPANLP